MFAVSINYDTFIERFAILGSASISHFLGLFSYLANFTKDTVMYTYNCVKNQNYILNTFLYFKEFQDKWSNGEVFGKTDIYLKFNCTSWESGKIDTNHHP
jgi:hypothetical protein